jgi:PAS domain S-box-containing protein
VSLSGTSERASSGLSAEGSDVLLAGGLTGVSERELELARRLQLSSALAQLSRAIVRSRTREELFRSVCRVLVEQGGFCMAWVGWHTPDSALLFPVALWGDEAGDLASLEIRTDPLSEGRHPTVDALRQARPMICNDVLAEPTSLPWRLECERRGVGSFAVFPIEAEGAPRGTLSIHANAPATFDAQLVDLLANVALDMSFALDSLAREAGYRQAERTLRQERDFSNAVLNSLPGVFYLYDQRGKFLRWNQNLERVTGYGAAEIAGMHPLDFFAELDKPRVAARIEEVFQQGDSTLEADFVAKDGSVAPYQFTGVMTQLDGQTCLVGVGIDISKRQRAEQARHASEARYRTLFDYAPDGILIADTESYYVDANASMCRMLGYAQHELIGLHASDIVNPEEVEHINPALRLIESKSDYSREWQFQRRDGSRFSAEVIATAMPDGMVLGMVRDITERKRAERALRELNETLELKVAERTNELQAALLRAEAADQVKSAFLATMSHELRTPLNSIIGFTGIVLHGMAGPLNLEQTKQLGMVRSSARHLLELINDVLDLSKIEAQQLEMRREPFDLLASIERVTASVLPLLEQKGLTLTASLPVGPVHMLSDRRRVEQILLNLINNAIKFTLRGAVTLTVDVLSALPASECPGQPGPAVQLRVADTGIGIKPEDLATLFQPFRQIDSGLTRGHEGTGLGLAICRRLAGLLGGDIVVSSECAKGTVFTVTLPLGEALP